MIYENDPVEVVGLVKSSLGGVESKESDVVSFIVRHLLQHFREVSRSIADGTDFMKAQRCDLFMDWSNKSLHTTVETGVVQQGKQRFKAVPYIVVVVFFA